MTRTAIVWFRWDLRTEDNPAWAAATADYDAVVPVFIWGPEEEGPKPLGGASCWYLHHALERFDARLRDRGSRLIVRRGPAADVLEELVEATAADAVFANHRYEPYAVDRDGDVASRLADKGAGFERSHGHLLIEPDAVRTKTGKPYQVFTPFWKSIRATIADEFLDEWKETSGVAADRRRKGRNDFPSPDTWPASVPIDDLGLLPTPDWAGGLRDTWTPGREGAIDRLRTFLDGPVLEYEHDRDFPAIEGTSRLSPHLRFGEIGVREVYVATVEKHGAEAADTFLSELAWREFAYHLLVHFPDTIGAPLKEKFDRMPWRDDPDGLRAWRRGETGFPIVDAGMRQLYATGWMHNRVRMIVGSFLTKDLLIDWREGEAWFWDCLVDADPASNTLGWQWVSGCGADAAPFFRIFNPTTQSERYDGKGDYIREFVEELDGLNPKAIHAPRRVDGYPGPVVDHGERRDAALEAYKAIK
ncbi:MAG: deoxyribodipyrimidine photo-lyase [Planctomycetota bacterium]